MMENEDVLSSLVSKYYESDMFKIMLKSTIKECMKPLNEKVKALESRLRDLEDKLKVQKELEKAEQTSTPKSQLELNLATHLLNTIDISESFIISPVSIILAIHPFFKSASPQLRLKWAKLFLEGGTPDDMTEYFVDLLSVVRASVVWYEIKRSDGKENDPTIQHLNEGYHGLEENVFKDFLSTKLKFIEFESDEMIVNSINYNPIFDETIHKFFTSKRTFYSTESSPQTMGFMEWRAHLHHFSEDDTFQMTEIQMRQHISLHIFLPKFRFGLRNALKNLKNGEKLYQLISTAEKKFVNIALPRFNINMETDLASFMRSIGIEKELYDTISEKVYGSIPSFVHKSQFELTFKKHSLEELLYNDDCVDDTDYTGLVHDSAPFCVYFPTHSTKLEFLADHPFLFMLVKDSHVVYFGFYQ